RRLKQVMHLRNKFYNRGLMLNGSHRRRKSRIRLLLKYLK
ncbi:aconitate B N-terminal domain protein, partial [Vibrio harveyi]